MSFPGAGLACLSVDVSAECGVRGEKRQGTCGERPVEGESVRLRSHRCVYTDSGEGCEW